MAEAGLFIGWGQVVRGRDQRAVEVFNTMVEYYGGLQQDGRIERFDTAFLLPHGGDLRGFVMLSGSERQMAAVRADEDFTRHMQRADLVVDSLGIVDALVGEGIAPGGDVHRGDRRARLTRPAGRLSSRLGGCPTAGRSA